MSTTPEHVPSQGPISTSALLWSSVKTAATPFGIELSIIGLFIYFAPPLWPAWLSLALLTLSAACATLLFACLIEVRQRLVPSRPVAIAGMKAHDPYSSAKAIILASRCSSLHPGAPVTLEIRDGGYEREIGYGSIVKVQSDGSTVITIERWCIGVEPHVIEGIQENRKSIISALIIRLDFQQYVPGQKTLGKPALLGPPGPPSLPGPGLPSSPEKCT